MIDPNFVMKQGSMLDEYIRDNARLHQRIAELEEEVEVKHRIIMAQAREIDALKAEGGADE